ncbi:hypothetical protein IGI58_002824 [Enterococcus sp. AZ020]
MKVYKSMNDRYRLAEIDKEICDGSVKIEKRQLFVTITIFLSK